jgi:hypothetical protein
VTFGATLKAVEEIRAAVERFIVQSPRFAGYQYGLVDQVALSISGPSNEAIFNDAELVKIARRALKKAEHYADLDVANKKHLS